MMSIRLDTRPISKTFFGQECERIITEVIQCHHRSIENVCSHYQTDLEKGLTEAQVQKKLQEHGYNELKERPKPGFLKMLLDQFNNFLVIILIIAVVISLLPGEIGDAIAIMVIVALNAIVGVIQESKAGLFRNDAEKIFPRVMEIPFDSDRN